MSAKPWADLIADAFDAQYNDRTGADPRALIAEVIRAARRDALDEAANLCRACHAKGYSAGEAGIEVRALKADAPTS